MYWGKYVQHDNNRDGMGQYLATDQSFTAGCWNGTRRCCTICMKRRHICMFPPEPVLIMMSLDPIAMDEWWMLAETEIMEMAKRGVPGVLTYGYYDGWVPNYLFWIALTHNSFGRFYEVQSYGPDTNDSHSGADHRDKPGMVSAESAAALHQVGSAK